MYNCSTIKAILLLDYTDSSITCVRYQYFFHILAISLLLLFSQNIFKKDHFPPPFFSYHLSITINIKSTCHKSQQKIIHFFNNLYTPSPQKKFKLKHWRFWSCVKLWSLSVAITSTLRTTNSRCAAYLTVYETEFNPRLYKKEVVLIIKLLYVSNTTSNILDEQN